MTELEAVNRILATIGEQPVSSLTGDKTQDVSLALSTLREVLSDEQQRGWYFNTEYEFTLARSGTEIPLPSNTIRVEIDPRRYSDLDPIQRGLKLYDRKNKTFTFDRELIADRFVKCLEFDDTPETFRKFIAIKAARRFADRWQGSTITHAYTERDEVNASSEWQREQLRVEPVSLRDNSLVRNITERNRRSGRIIR